jgi:hypothetical protein
LRARDDLLMRGCAVCSTIVEMFPRSFSNANTALITGRKFALRGALIASAQGCSDERTFRRKVISTIDGRPSFFDQQAPIRRADRTA